MALAAGDRLGRFEIVALVGAGAMGEVYRARDPDLERLVAIKVLPAGVAGDRARLERFEQEARAVGRLDHPNLMAIHDLGRHEGAPYLVCEMLEGETLRERLAQGPMSIREALRGAGQIAEGLAAAHERGVVHRDLKPANIFLTADGRAKVLDFGLARLTETALPGGSELPTRSEITGQGVVLGTVAYMAPEQAAGRRVDHRADQFALGVVLYEMLSERPPFLGDTAGETLAAILRDEPPPLARTAPHVPPPVRWIVERCLARDPRERYDSTRDLARDLRTLEARLPELAGAAGAPTNEPPSRRSPVLLGAAGGGLLAVVLLLTLLVLGRRAPTPQLGYERLTFRRGTVTGARFEPGGNGVLYSATWDGAPSRLYLHRPADLDPLAIGPAGAELLSVSGQGDVLLLTDVVAVGPFLRAGTLNRMPISGGPRALRERVVGATFGSNGELAAIVREVEGQTQLEFPPGTPRVTTRGLILNLRLSPDGRRVAFVETLGRGRPQGRIVVLERDGEPTRFTQEGGNGLAWSPSGREIWFALPAPGGTSMNAIDLDGRERRIATFPTEIFLFDVSVEGRVLLGMEQVRYETAGRPAGGEERHLTWLGWSVPFDVSAGGDRVLFNECSVGQCRVALRAFGPEPPVVLGDGFGMSLSRDGKWVLSIPPWSEREITLIATDRAETRAVPAERVERIALGAWSPDGRHLYLNGNLPGEGNRIFRLGLDGGVPVPVTPEGIEFGFFAVSPDGRRVAAHLSAGGIAVFAIDGGEPTHIDHDAQPIRWSDDGRSVFTVPLSSAPADLSRLDVASGTTRLVARLMPPDPAGVLQVSPVAVTPDGAAYVYGYVRRLTDLFIVDGLE